jgi:hypothetical protein
VSDIGFTEAAEMLGPEHAHEAWAAGPADLGLPLFAHREFGVTLDWLGTEGSVVAHGHVNQFRLAWACYWLARQDDSRDLYVTRNFFSEIRHLWAVHAFASTPEDWRLHWDGVAEGTPGAFPVTIYGPGWLRLQTSRGRYRQRLCRSRESRSGKGENHVPPHD